MTGDPRDMPADWDPHAPDVARDQRAAYDEMRGRCPVAHSGPGQWTIFRHADVVRVVTDHETFSNVVSSHVSVPSGMDPPEHTPFRRINEAYFTHQRVDAFEPACRAIAATLVIDACAFDDIEVMGRLALPFAARAQCAYMGWPATLDTTLVDWTHRNHRARLAGDRAAMNAIAAEFQSLVGDLLRDRSTDPAVPARDLTESLLRERVDDRALTLPEITSVLRNWTMGEVGTIAASVGILAHYLANDVDVQYQLRRDMTLLPDGIDEILRLHGPLVSNRRVATRRVELGGRTIKAGQRLSVNWISANRDPATFTQPDRFRLDRNSADNLLYGAGIHVCPGAPLARMELRVLMEELLAGTRSIKEIAERPPVKAGAPAAGFSSVPLRFEPA